jgi:hypothetical protein
VDGRGCHWPLPRWLGVVQDLLAFIDSRDEVPFTRPLPRFPIPRVSSLPAAKFWVGYRLVLTYFKDNQ